MSDEGGKRPERQPEDEFVPRGAIAFMVLMMLAYGAIWLFFYSLILGRP